MKYYFYILLILIFLFKTGNVLSQNSIFNVDNIEIDRAKYKNKSNSLDYAFKKGFEKLTNRILLKKDINSITNIKLEEIKSIISYYQVITEKREDNTPQTKINIIFDRDRINDFFYKKNISYADISNSKILVFPILIEEDEFFLFSKNYFYTFWNSKEEENLREYVDYILPVENLESIEIIKNNFDQLEEIDISKLDTGYDIENYIYLVINNVNDYINIFIKGVVGENKVARSFKFEKKLPKKNEDYEIVLKKIKQEIIEIIKSQNLIDLRTPSFLNLNLQLNKADDLFKIQKLFENIEIIESFDVKELNSQKAKIKIKFYGKIDKIFSKIKSKGIQLDLINDEWNIKL